MNGYQKFSIWSVPVLLAVLWFAEDLGVSGTTRIVLIIGACAVVLAGLAVDFLDLARFARKRGEGKADASINSRQPEPRIAKPSAWWRRDLGPKRRTAEVSLLVGALLSYPASVIHGPTRVVVWLLALSVFAYGVWLFASAPRARK